MPPWRDIIVYQSNLMNMGDICFNEDGVSTIINEKVRIVLILGIHGYDEPLVYTVEYFPGFIARTKPVVLQSIVLDGASLQAMGEAMEDMRERGAAPDLIGTRVPVEVHIQSIQAGLDRLHQGKMVARRLEEDAIRSALVEL